MNHKKEILIAIGNKCIKRIIITRTMNKKIKKLIVKKKFIIFKCSP